MSDGVGAATLALATTEGTMKVRDVMRTDVTTVERSTSLREVAKILAEHGISGVPVVDGDGNVVGVVSEADILMKERGPDLRRRGWVARLLDPPDPDAAGKLEARTAGEAMTSPAITVEPGAHVAQAAGLMTEEGVNRLPIVDDGALVGIVSEPISSARSRGPTTRSLARSARTSSCGRSGSRRRR
jgi:CBS domain-containing protein